MEGPQTPVSQEHDRPVQAAACLVAQGDLEAGLLLQERQVRDISNNDHSEPLRVALQRYFLNVHGQVSTRQHSI